MLQFSDKGRNTDSRHLGRPGLPPQHLPFRYHGGGVIVAITGEGYGWGTAVNSWPSLEWNRKLEILQKCL